MAAALLTAALATAVVAAPAHAATSVAIGPCGGSGPALYVLCEVGAAIGASGATGVTSVQSAAGTDGNWLALKNTGQTYTSGPTTNTVRARENGATRGAHAYTVTDTRKRTGETSLSIYYDFAVSGRAYRHRTVLHHADYAVASKTFTVSSSVETLTCRRVGATRQVNKDCRTGTLTTFGRSGAAAPRYTVSGSRVTISQPSLLERWTISRSSTGSFVQTLQSTTPATYTFSGTVSRTAVRGTAAWTVSGQSAVRRHVTAARQPRTWKVASSKA